MRAATFVKVGIVAAGVAAFAGLLAAHLPRSQTRLWIVAIVLPGACLWHAVSWIDSKRRRSELSEWLARRGFDVIPPPQFEDHPETELLLDPKTRQGLPSLHLAAVGKHSGLKVHIAEFTLSRNRAEWACFQATVPCPAVWPRLALRPRPGVANRPLKELLRPRSRSAALQAAFAERWVLDSDDESFADRMLTPSIQRWLLDAPKREEWLIGGERIACTWARACGPAEAETVIGRVAEFARLLPAELHAWAPPASEAGFPSMGVPATTRPS